MTTAVILALCGGYAVVSLTQALKNDFDFHHFHDDARFVWQHRRLPPTTAVDGSPVRQLPFYLPSVSILLSPLGAAGPAGAACIWAALQTISLGFVLRRLDAWMNPGDRLGADSAADGVARPARESWRAARLLALAALSAPMLYEAARFNQLTLPVLAMALAGGAALESRREVRAGVWLALAATVKLLPGLLAVWLVLSRRWRAAAACAIVAAALICIPSLGVLGPREFVREHAQWWRHNVQGAIGQGLTSPSLREHFVDHRNQSIAAIIARLTRPDHPHRTGWQPIALDEAAGRLLAWALAAGLAIALAIWTIASARGPNSGAADDPVDAARTGALRRQLAVYLIAMLALSPLVRTYYLAWGMPALALFVHASLGASGRAALVGRAGICIWIAGLLGWPIEALRTFGLHWFAMAAMIVAAGALPNAAALPRGEETRR